MSVDITSLCQDLNAERESLHQLLADLEEHQWSTTTPAAGWTVLDQVTHLAFFDDQATLSILDPASFRASLTQLGSVQAFVDEVTDQHRSLSGQQAGAWLQQSGRALIDAALTAEPGLRAPWFGPSMTVASTITARIMETWAHGQDIADTLGVEREPTLRLKHTAFIGVRAFANSFHANGLEVPDVAIRIELVAPDGSVVCFGPENAEERVTGSMHDFCVLVTQRRHRSDTDLLATGPTANRWLDLAQAFAGPPGAGREPQS